jgi:molybdate/tungstate transport system ATP-binding protein
MSLTLSGIEKHHPDFSLGPVDLSVADSITAILGPSGSGKTTLLDVIAGFDSPDRGEVRLDGRPLEPVPPEDRRIGVVFQDYALFPHLSVVENLDFGAQDGGSIDEVADLLAIEDLLDRMPDTLSGGEKQRVALGRALVAQPDALLLDEPLSNLDAPIRRRLQRELRGILSELSIPVVYITHNQDEAATVADSLVVLRDGRVCQSGPVETVFSHPKTPFVADFLGVENLFEGTVVSSGPDGTQVDLGWTTITALEEAVGATVTVGMRPEDVDLAPVSENPGGPNAIRCRIERIVPKRTGAIVSIEASEGTDLVVRRWQTGLPTGVEVGAMAVATVDPEAVVLLE